MFKNQSTLVGQVPPFETYPKTASEEILLGEVLKLASGKLTKGGDAPEFVSRSSAAATFTGDVTVERINDFDEYETELSASGASLNVGDKVTIASDGLRATATTTSGVFTITKILGTATGSKIRGMFRR